MYLLGWSPLVSARGATPWKPLALLTVILSAPGCAGITVNHEFDPDAGFASYRTYDWMPTEARRVDLRARDPMVEQWIRDAIQRELGAKGFRIAEGSEPDVRIGYLLVLEDNLDSQTLYESSDPDWRYRSYGPLTATTRSGMLTSGTLVVDVFDVARKESVWRGVAEGPVKGTVEPEKRRERIHEAVKKILEDFPPKG